MLRRGRKRENQSVPPNRGAIKTFFAVPNGLPPSFHTAPVSHIVFRTLPVPTLTPPSLYPSKSIPSQHVSEHFLFLLGHRPKLSPTSLIVFSSVVSDLSLRFLADCLSPTLLHPRHFLCATPYLPPRHSRVLLMKF